MSFTGYFPVQVKLSNNNNNINEHLKWVGICQKDSHETSVIMGKVSSKITMKRKSMKLLSC